MLRMTNNDWDFGTGSGGNDGGWNFVPQESPEQKRTSANINSGFQPEAKGVEKLRGPWYWPLTIVAFLIVGGLSFLMAYLTKDIPERNELLMGLIFAVPMAAMFLASLLLEHRTCAMTPSYLRKSQCIIALAAVVATFGVGTLCDWIYLHNFVAAGRCPDTVFVLDKSGSMSAYLEANKTYNQVMIESVDTCLDGISPYTEVGLVLFGTTVCGEVELAPLTDAHKAAIVKRMTDEPADDGYNYFQLGINAALDMFREQDGNGPRQIIFLTDGYEWGFTEYVESLSKECKQLNVTVNAVGFGEAASVQQLQALVDNTGGMTKSATAAEELVSVFASWVTYDGDMIRSQDPKANLMTGIMLILEGLVIGLGMWLMLSVHGQLRAQMIISPLMGAAGLVLLKYVGFDAELDYWWIVEGAAFTLLGIVFMTKNRLLNRPEDQPQNQQNQQGQQQQQPQAQVPDFDFF